MATGRNTSMNQDILLSSFHFLQLYPPPPVELGQHVDEVRVSTIDDGIHLFDQQNVCSATRASAF